MQAFVRDGPDEFRGACQSPDAICSRFGLRGWAKNASATAPVGSAKSAVRKASSGMIIQFRTGWSSRQRPRASMSTRRSTRLGMAAPSSQASMPPTELADNCRRAQLQSIQEFRVIRHQVQQRVQLVDRLGVTWRSPWMARRVHCVRGGERLHVREVWRQAPWPVEVHQRRPVANYVHVRGDAVLPQPSSR